MRAFKFGVSKGNGDHSSSDTHVKPAEPGTLWAVVRRLSAKVRDLEAQLAIVRRDVNRIDRKQYREAENKAPSHAEMMAGGDIPADDKLPQGLFW